MFNVILSLSLLTPKIQEAFMAKEDGHFSLLFFVKIPRDSLMMILKIFASAGVGTAAVAEIASKYMN